jgi:hypothetical protein
MRMNQKMKMNYGKMKMNYGNECRNWENIENGRWK